MNEPRKLLLRRGEVIEWTGISTQYLDKLVELKIITARQFRPRGRMFFYRREIEELLDYRGEYKTGEHKRGNGTNAKLR